MTWEEVVALGERLPGVEESTWWRTPALKVRGKAMCRLREDPDALVIRVLDEEDKRALIAESPDVFFTIPHYDGHPYVLVRLEAVSAEQMRQLLEDAWVQSGGS